MIRLFVGLALPPDIAFTLVGLNGGLPNARWLAERDLHVTLQFVGEVDETQAAQLDDGLAQIQHPAFKVAVRDLGTFGRAKPHTLWAGIAANPALVHLHDKIYNLCHRLALPVQPRKYTPHITLARLHNAPLGRLQAIITQHSPFNGGDWQATHFTLFQSLPSAQGATYQHLVDYALTSGPVCQP